MLEENISEKSAFVRIVIGIGLTACGISHLVKENGKKWMGTLSVAAGAIKIAEGLFLYCPMKAMLSRNVKDAVTSSIQDFMDMDGESLMTAFSSRYANSSNQNSNTQSSSGNEGAELLQTAANVVEKVASTTPAGTEAHEAAKTVQTVANSQNNSK
ncbi:DUF2892 domain-containing protein [Ureibacillus thermophilus]|uniref:YgaP family membrane protein n=1 Tax=Ureibacillus thermophilus TaxID=367743 RepID=UPI00361C16DB